MDATFQSDGILRLPGVLDVEVVKNVRARFWDEIGTRFGIRADDPGTWFVNANKPAGDVRGRRLAGMNPVMNALKDSAALDSLESSLRRVVNQSLGPSRWSPKPRWYSLLSFPGGNPVWNVPHRSWHADEPIAAGHTRPWSVFAFVFLDTVEPRGGGTVVVAGSQRRGERLAQKVGAVNEALVSAFQDDNEGLVGSADDLRLVSPIEFVKALALEDPWVRDLTSEGSPEERIQRFMNKRTESAGIPLKVIELAATAGDVILLDPRCLHSFSANTKGVPRQVLRLDFRRRD